MNRATKHFETPKNDTNIDQEPVYTPS